ncbi:MAG: glutamine-hydrolyzing carbamoyl-phosphate synthase small subunit [Candidatus Lokiarchaeota archaeon]|nr:glutamine-hydrolyzing carbamoyl-phosphate synthase small subunit [Candidatus Lokiarchaeota archaeon]
MVSIETLDDYRKAVLVLSNGKIFRGKGIGATKKIFGEFVFNTATACGYNCALTDASNKRQIYVFTYPLIGNYGVPPWEEDEFRIYKWFEGEQIYLEAVVVHESCKKPHHYESVKTFDEFLKEQDVPGMEGVDTRELTKILRKEGVQVGMLQVFEKGAEIPEDEVLLEQVKQAPDPNDFHLVKEVSIKSPKKYTPKDPVGRVVLVDCGVKLNIIRNLVKRHLEVVRVPFDISYEDVMNYNPNGVVLSNGPGDPQMCVETIELCRKLIENNVPTMGICLGTQIMGLAVGGTTSKLKYGHRGANKPVKDLITNKCYITSQNHGYVVDADSVKGAGFKVLFKNLDDGSVEGLIHETKPIFAIQFHPEACAGPLDTIYLFNKFLRNMNLPIKEESLCH